VLLLLYDTETNKTVITDGLPVIYSVDIKYIALWSAYAIDAELEQFTLDKSWKAWVNQLHCQFSGPTPTKTPQTLHIERGGPKK